MTGSYSKGGLLKQIIIGNVMVFYYVLERLRKGLMRRWVETKLCTLKGCTLLHTVGQIIDSKLNKNSGMCDTKKYFQYHIILAVYFSNLN